MELQSWSIEPLSLSQILQVCNFASDRSRGDEKKFPNLISLIESTSAEKNESGKKKWDNRINYPIPNKIREKMNLNIGRLFFWEVGRAINICLFVSPKAKPLLIYPQRPVKGEFVRCFASKDL